MKFEIHVTIEVGDINKFRYDCELIKVKPIIIETEKNNHRSKQLMTSSKYDECDYADRLETITKFLKGSGYRVLREKVEIFPNQEKHSKFIYYETHLRLKLPKGYDKGLLREMCQRHGFHLSRNLFKQNEHFDFQMMTYRSKVDSYVKFMEVIDKMKTELTYKNLEFDKIEVEECIYDSNEMVDANWLVF